MAGHGFDPIKIQATHTPGKVWVGNAGLVLILLAILSPLTGSEAWASVWTLVAIGLLILGGIIAINIPDRHVGEVFDPITRARRVVFPGFHAKGFWEGLDPRLTLVKRELVQHIEKEPHTTNDPAETMEAYYVIHIIPDVGGSPATAAEKFMRFRSINEVTLKHLVHTTASQMLNGYYGAKEMEQLTKATVIQREVFEDPVNADVLKELEARYGVHIGVSMQKSLPDPRTQALKTTPARAEALRDARRKLREGDDAWSPEGAEDAVLLIDENADFKKDKSEYKFDVNAPDLKNLHDVNIIPLGGLGKKGDKK